MMDLSIELRKQVKGFALDVQWEAGNELVVLFGHSGSGKSMTLRMISGLAAPDEGRIRCNGEDYFSSSTGIHVPPQRRSIGYVFQEPALFPHMTVRENILYGVRKGSRSERRGLFDEMAEAFHIEGLEHGMPSELSGGQKQRVAFARALIRRPSLLLLDEPFSALDTLLRYEMRDLLLRIRDEFGIPVVLVTHDPAEAYYLADRVVVYSGGTVLLAGTPEEIFSGPLEKVLSPAPMKRGARPEYVFQPLSTMNRRMAPGGTCP